MHKLTNQYKLSIKKFEDFKIKAESLVLELLIQNNISYHKIESRVKDINKLDEKIFRKKEKYNCLNDITDLIGVRIITFLEDDVDKVANIIEQEFDIDKENSIDKRTLESDRFGYRSLHFVISLKEDRKILTEYKRFIDLKIEVQIRSILQHAWAEIEHDLGYKSEQTIPDIFRRNFYRVAALLETADIEFVNIKKGLDKYEKNIALKIKKYPENVDINSASLKSFILSNDTVKFIDKQIASNSRCKLNRKEKTLNVDDHVKRLLFLNISTIKDLEDALIEEKEVIIKFAKEWLGDELEGINFDYGISLFYLCYVLVGKKNDPELSNEYYKTMISKNGYIDYASGIIDSYKKIKND